MNKDIQKINKEKDELVKRLQQIETEKNQIITRLAELQGVLKYLQEKIQEEKEDKDNKK